MNALPPLKSHLAATPSLPLPSSYILISPKAKILQTASEGSRGSAAGTDTKTTLSPVSCIHAAAPSFSPSLSRSLFTCRLQARHPSPANQKGGRKPDRYGRLFQGRAMPMLEASPQGQRPDPAAAIDLVLQKSADADVCWYVVVCNGNPLADGSLRYCFAKRAFEKSEAVFSRWLMNVLDGSVGSGSTDTKTCVALALTLA